MTYNELSLNWRYHKVGVHIRQVVQLLTDRFFINYHKVVGNKAKGRISKRVFQENKARQIFRKTNIFTP